MSSGLSRYRLPKSCASRSGLGKALDGLSEKRTVLDTARAFLGLRLELAAEGFCAACSKSAFRDGSFGCVSVSAVDGEEKPWNCEVRSPYCFFRPGRESEMSRAPLTTKSVERLMPDA